MALTTATENYGVNLASCQSFLDCILPVYGNARCKVPVWDEGDKMFISDEYESEAGNRYYKGLRFSSHIAIVEKVGLFHNWKYIDSIEVYSYNCDSRQLIGTRTFDNQFYDKNIIRAAAEQIVLDYIKAQIKICGASIAADKTAVAAKEFVTGAYVSFLSDEYNIALFQLLPILQTN